MRYVEMTVRFRSFLEVVFVIPVGNKLNPCGCHCLELFFYKRRHGHNHSCIIKHLLFKFFMLPSCLLAKMQMLEIEHLCPRVTEICNPWCSGGKRKPSCYQVHRMRRSCAYYYVHRMFLEIFFEESDRRANPHASRVRYEAVAPYP